MRFVYDEELMTVARRMAQWAKALRSDHLPDKTIHEVKRRIIDSIATTLGAYHSHPAKIVREKAMAVADPNAKATVWGTKHRTLPELAAFANGAMVRYLDYNDTYLSLEPAHPSDNLSAAVAVTQQHSHIAGVQIGGDNVRSAVTVQIANR